MKEKIEAGASDLKISLLAPALFFLIAAEILLFFVVPPFQNPDEPQHFGLIMTITRGVENQAEVEKELIGALDRHRFWRFIGLGQPSPLPSRLSEIPFLMDYYPTTDFKERLLSLSLYHRLLAKTLRFLKIKEIETAYFLCRFFSLVFFFFSLLILALAWVKIIRPKNQLLAAGFLFAFFLPQLLLTAPSVSPESFCLAVGTPFFACAFALVSGKNNLFLWLLVLSLGAISLFVDRSLFVLPASLPFIFLLALRPKTWKAQVVAAMFAFICFLFLMMGLVSFFPKESEAIFELVRTNIGRAWKNLPQLFSLQPFNRQFILLAADSFFLRFGWMAFPPAKIFYWIWQVALISAVLGTLIAVARAAGELILVKIVKRKEMAQEASDEIDWRPKRENNFEEKTTIEQINRKQNNDNQDNQRKIIQEKFRLAVLTLKFIFLALVVASIQMAAAWTFYGLGKKMAQGRHFFPLLLPLAFLFLGGLYSLTRLVHRRAAVISLGAFLLFEFLFLGAVLWSQVVPVFHLILKSPHAGL